MTVAMIVVPTISVGEIELYCILIAITVVGTSVKLDVFKARNVITERVAVSVPLSCFICSIALMPIGVAALPKPNILAVKFEIIYPIAGCPGGISGNNLTTIGFNSLARTFKIFAFSAIFIIPSQKTKTLIKPIDNVTARSEERR